MIGGVSDWTKERQRGNLDLEMLLAELNYTPPTPAFIFTRDGLVVLNRPEYDV